MRQEELHDKFEHIYRVITSPNFLTMEALGGEIPFWISAYNPTQEIDVNKDIGHLQTRLRNEGIPSVSINLFELAISIVDDKIGRDRLYQIERKKDKEKFKGALQSTINIHERLIPEIESRVQSEEVKVLFLYGVGSVFPFIRSHTVLNNLQSAIKEIPTVMFFPGNYTGNSLELFGLLKDDNYYRAFNIDKYKVGSHD